MSSILKCEKQAQLTEMKMQFKGSMAACTLRTLCALRGINLGTALAEYRPALMYRDTTHTSTPAPFTRATEGWFVMTTYS